jgi:hypothetical protein
VFEIHECNTVHGSRIIRPIAGACNLLGWHRFGLATITTFCTTQLRKPSLDCSSECAGYSKFKLHSPSATSPSPCSLSRNPRLLNPHYIRWRTYIWCCCCISGSLRVGTFTFRFQWLRIHAHCLASRVPPVPCLVLCSLRMSSLGSILGLHYSPHDQGRELESECLRSVPTPPQASPSSSAYGGHLQAYGSCDNGSLDYFRIQLAGPTWPPWLEG